MAAQTQTQTKGSMDAMEVMKALQAPFDLNDIEWRVQRGVKTRNGDKAVVMAYITNRAIQKRLDNLFSPFGWKNEFHEWRNEGVMCGISILWNGEWVTKFDGADATGVEGTKGGFSASQKRAAVEWGIGRYLYDLPEYWVDVKEKGQFYIDDKKSGVKGYWDSPILPTWALPEGSYRKPNSQSGRNSDEPGEGKIVNLPNRNNPSFICALVAMRFGVSAEDLDYCEMVFQKDGKDAKIHAFGEMYEKVATMDLAEGNFYRIVTEKVNGIHQLKSIEEVNE